MLFVYYFATRADTGGPSDQPGVKTEVRGNRIDKKCRNCFNKKMINIFFLFLNLNNMAL